MPLASRLNAALQVRRARRSKPHRLQVRRWSRETQSCPVLHHLSRRGATAQWYRAPRLL